MLPRMKVWLLLLLVAALSPRAAAALRPPVPMAVERESLSVPLGAWERGHLHMYLEQNGFACMLGAKVKPRGALTLRLEAAAGQPTRVTIVDDRQLAPRAFAACLKGALRRVAFANLAPRFQWEGTLRYAPDNQVEVEVRSLYGKLYELTMQHVIRAALTPSLPCLAPFFQAEPALSQVVLASFDVDPSGATAQVEVSASTAGDEQTLACVKQGLGALTFPPGTLTGAKLRIALLRIARGAGPEGKVGGVISGGDAR